MLWRLDFDRPCGIGRECGLHCAKKVVPLAACWLQVADDAAEGDGALRCPDAAPVLSPCHKHVRFRANVQHRRLRQGKARLPRRPVALDEAASSGHVPGECMLSRFPSREIDVTRLRIAVPGFRVRAGQTGAAARAALPSWAAGLGMGRRRSVQAQRDGPLLRVLTTAARSRPGVECIRLH